jgi:hypothetical protein
LLEEYDTILGYNTIEPSVKVTLIIFVKYEPITIIVLLPYILPEDSLNDVIIGKFTYVNPFTIVFVIPDVVIDIFTVPAFKLAGELKVNVLPELVTVG